MQIFYLTNKSNIILITFETQCFKTIVTTMIRYIRLALAPVLFTTGLSFAPVARADCWSTFLSELDSCDTAYPPPQNVAWETCVASARRAYEACIS